MIKYGEVILLLYDVTVTEKAYAKINLFLDCERKRSDGYHDIVSVMQSVSLFDNVSVKIYENGTDRLFCNDPSVPGGTKSLPLIQPVIIDTISLMFVFSAISQKLSKCSSIIGSSPNSSKSGLSSERRYSICFPCHPRRCVIG